ncbi:hypothetical protein [Numidum massiliense]|nr:hypothetical protein [Numidum massiliense]
MKKIVASLTIIALLLMPFTAFASPTGPGPDLGALKVKQKQIVK